MPERKIYYFVLSEFFLQLFFAFCCSFFSGYKAGGDIIKTNTGLPYFPFYAPLIFLMYSIGVSSFYAKHKLKRIFIEIYIASFIPFAFALLCIWEPLCLYSYCGTSYSRYFNLQKRKTINSRSLLPFGRRLPLWMWGVKEKDG